MEIHTKKIYNKEGKITGLSYAAELDRKTDPVTKAGVENKLIQQAHKEANGQGIKIFREIHVDTPAITVIYNFNDLPGGKIVLQQ